MKKVLCMVFAVAILSLPAFAQETERKSVEGSFEKYDRRTVTLTGEGTFVISPSFSAPILSKLSQAIRGQKIKLTLRETLVIEVELDNSGFEVDVTYDDKIQVGSGYILRFKEGAQFPVEQTKLAAVSKNLFFVNRNIKVRITLLAGKIIGLEVKNSSMAPPRQNLNPEIEAQIKQLKKADKVVINEVYFGRVLSFDDQSLTYQPLTKTGEEKGNEKWFAFGLIEKLEIEGSKASSDKPKVDDPKKIDPTTFVQGKDAIAKLNLVLGDTIGVGLKKGILSSLSKDNIGLLVWDRDQFSETVEYERAVVAGKVRRTRLSADRKYKVQGGTIRVVSQRLRDQSKGIFEFEVRVTHNVDGVILVDSELRAFKNPGKKTGPVGNAEPLPPIFANELFRWKKLVTIDDPKIEMVLVLKPKSLVKMQSPEATLAIGRRLSKPKPGDRLQRAYQAVIDNQDPGLIAMLVSHLVMPSFKSDVKRLALASFQRAGGKASGVLVDILTKDSDKLEFILPDELGRPVKKPLKISVREYRGRALRLLGQYNAQLPFDQVEKLLRLSESYEGTQEADDYVQVLRQHVDSICATVVDIAARAKPDEELFKLGSDILRALGKLALKPLVALLRDRGLEKEARDIETQLRTQKPAVLVQAAIEKVVMVQRERGLKTLQIQLRQLNKDMKAAAKIKENLDAVVAWQKILKTHQELPQDKIFVIEVLPGILLNYGNRLMKAKQRGEAMTQFQRGLELIKANRDSRFMAKSRRGLSKGAGRIYLAALNEELTGVSIRKGPGFGFEPIRLANVGDVFPSVVEKKPVKGWFPLRVGNRVGWLHSMVVQKTKSGNGLRLTTSTLPLSSLQRMLADGRKFDSSNTDLLNKVQADLINREIDQLIQANDFESVLDRIDQLKKIAPNHPTVKKQYYAWAMLYWLYPTLFGSVLVGALVFWFVHLLINRQKKIKSTNQEYLYYGKDRSEIERTFE